MNTRTGLVSRTLPVHLMTGVQKKIVACRIQFRQDVFLCKTRFHVLLDWIRAWRCRGHHS